MFSAEAAANAWVDEMAKVEERRGAVPTIYQLPHDSRWYAKIESAAGKMLCRSILDSESEMRDRAEPVLAELLGGGQAAARQVLNRAVRAYRVEHPERAATPLKNTSAPRAAPKRREVKPVTPVRASTTRQNQPNRVRAGSWVVEAIDAYRARTARSTVSVVFPTRGEENNGIWQVNFMHYEIGFFDLETCRLEPVENPFGAKVLTMSPVSSANHVTGMHPRRLVGRAGLEPATNGLRVRSKAHGNQWFVAEVFDSSIVVRTCPGRKWSRSDPAVSMNCPRPRGAGEGWSAEAGGGVGVDRGPPESSRAVRLGLGRRTVWAAEPVFVVRRAMSRMRTEADSRTPGSPASERAPPIL
ncbi:MAG TPA: hypothetical protein VMU33_20240 [Burkholderiaceae bacterium]|nr:hypothetical protein [Burkholderiaceae bacterium]